MKKALPEGVARKRSKACSDLLKEGKQEQNEDLPEPGKTKGKSHTV